MTETLAHGYASESSQRDLSSEYQHDRVQIFFKNMFVFQLWTSSIEWVKGILREVISYPVIFSLSVVWTYDTFENNLGGNSHIWRQVVGWVLNNIFQPTLSEKKLGRKIYKQKYIHRFIVGQQTPLSLRKVFRFSSVLLKFEKKIRSTKIDIDIY